MEKKCFGIPGLGFYVILFWVFMFLAAIAPQCAEA